MYVLNALFGAHVEVYIQYGSAKTKHSLVALKLFGSL